MSQALRSKEVQTNKNDWKIHVFKGASQVLTFYALLSGFTQSFENSFENTESKIGIVGFAFYNGLWAYDGWWVMWHLFSFRYRDSLLVQIEFDILSTPQDHIFCLRPAIEADKPAGESSPRAHNTAWQSSQFAFQHDFFSLIQWQPPLQ